MQYHSGALYPIEVQQRSSHTLKRTKQYKPGGIPAHNRLRSHSTACQCNTQLQAQMALHYLKQGSDSGSSTNTNVLQLIDSDFDSQHHSIEYCYNSSYGESDRTTSRRWHNVRLLACQWRAWTSSLQAGGAEHCTHSDR